MVRSRVHLDLWAVCSGGSRRGTNSNEIVRPHLELVIKRRQKGRRAVQPRKRARCSSERERERRMEMGTRAVGAAPAEKEKESKAI